MTIAALYGSHDATLCVLTDDGRVRNFEFERWFKQRYWRFPKKPDEETTAAIAAALSLAGADVPRICYYQMLPKAWVSHLQALWPSCQFVWQPHHPSHAAGAFVQSGLDEAVVVSYDGGGHDEPDERELSSFKVFHARAGQPLELIKEYPWNLGIGYGLLGWSLDSIYKNPDNDHRTEFLKFAGKIMGLSAYGDVHVDATESMLSLLCQAHTSTKPQIIYSDKTDADLAMSMQAAFTLALNEAINQRFAVPWVFTGGCALNVLANTEFDAAFVPPNPGDNGIPFGMLCLNGHITEPVPDLQYSGWPILDAPNREGRECSIDELAELLAAGKVIGVMRGNSEHGPRALGNRSILCDPREGMKDHLNAAVKFREDFRPYAPVVQERNATHYFQDCPPSPYMSYSPKAMEIHREKIGPSVIHVDGTSRVQTVARDDNPWLYDLLSAFMAKTGRVCLLNTSFNSRGRPILTTYEDAFAVLDETALDGVYAEGVLYE